jgi:TetR/AcrR family transcriptional repressor of bet genes
MGLIVQSVNLSEGDMGRAALHPQRRREIIDAAIGAIHDRGAADVTMAEVARRAGYSPALAHHYFGTKEAMLLAVMRRLLRDFGAEAARRLRAASEPRARASAVVSACFGPEQFRPETVGCWLALYALAQHHAPAARLLRVYFARLRANLTHALAPSCGRARAAALAEGAAAMIDGLYLRHGLSGAAPDGAAAAAQVEAFIDAGLRP